MAMGDRRGEPAPTPEDAAAAAKTVSETPDQSVDVLALTLCLLGNFLLRAAAAAAGTLISLHLASLQKAGVPINAQVVGLAAMLFYGTELLGSLGFGLASDLKGRKPFMVLGPALGAVAVQLIIIAPTIPLVLLARAFQGLSTASSVPSTLSYLSAETGYSQRLQGRVMSLFEVASIVGIAGGFAAGGVLWDRLGHSAFVAVLGAYLASVVFLLLVRERRRLQPRPRNLSAYLQHLRSASAMRLIPAWVAVNAIVGLWFSHLDFQMGKRDDTTQLLVGGYSGTQIGLYTGAAAVLFVVGIAAWSLAFGRLRPTRIMGIALGGLFGLVAAVLALNHSLSSDTLRIALSIVAAAACLLVMSGFTPAALVYLAGLAEATPDTRGSVMGLYSVFLGLGQLHGSGLGGAFAAWRGVDGMIVLTFLLGLISATCVFALARWDGADGAPAAAHH